MISLTEGEKALAVALPKLAEIARLATFRRSSHMPTQSPASALLASVGTTLYGPQWQAPLAREIGINPDSLRDWLTGRNTRFDLTHPVWPKIAEIVSSRIVPLLDIARQIDQKTTFAPADQDKQT